MNYTQAQYTRATAILLEVAVRNGVTLDKVRTSIMDAITEAMGSCSPEAKNLWNTITRQGDVPSPEEVIIWAEQQVSGKVLM